MNPLTILSEANNVFFNSSHFFSIYTTAFIYLSIREFFSKNLSTSSPGLLFTLDFGMMKRKRFLHTVLISKSKKQSWQAVSWHLFASFTSIAIFLKNTIFTKCNKTQTQISTDEEFRDFLLSLYVRRIEDHQYRMLWAKMVYTQSKINKQKNASEVSLEIQW